MNTSNTISFKPKVQRETKNNSKTGFSMGGEMEKRIRSKDWAESPLGTKENWPQNLRLALDICLASNSPISICWGSDHILLYNNAYSKLIGDNHPAALGRPADEAFGEAWQAIGPKLNHVYSTGEGTELKNQDLFLPVHGKCCFDFSFSPIPGEGGSTGGIFNIAAERTEHRRVAKRREHIEKALQIETVGVVFFTVEGEITNANDAFLKMSGYSREGLEAGKMRWDEMTPPEWMETSKKAIKELKDTGATSPYEKQYYRKDGSRWWALFSSKYLENGNCVEFVLDITERKRNEQLEAEQKKLLELIASDASLNDCLSSLCKSISRINSNVRASIMLANEECKKFNRPVAPDILTSFSEGLENAPINDLAIGTCGEAVYYGKPVKSKDIANDDRWSKEWRDLCVANDIRACHSEPIPGKDNDPAGSLMLCFSEPRERGQWEQRLADFGTHIASIAVERDRSRKVRERFKAALEIDTVGVIFWGDDFKITEVNDAFLQMSGFSYEEAIGLTWQELTPKEFHKVSEKAVNELNRKGRTDPYEKQYIRKDGSRWWGLFAPRKLESGEVAEFVIDVSERHLAEEELKAVNENLEERVEERTVSLLSYQEQLRSLASKLSKAEEQERHRLAAELHDNLGQMLAVGKMKVDLLQKGQLSAPVASGIGELKELVSDALTYTRELMSDLKPPPSLNKEDLRETIEWLAEKMEKHNLKVIIDDDGQPKRGSEEIQTTLLQAVRELFFNIIKHTETNEATVSLSRLDKQVQITVEDEGQGFDPETNNAASTEEGGFGLFNISERLDLLGGSMEISSESGQGTKVKLLAPLKDEEPGKPDGQAKGERKSGDKKMGPKVKVLLVDDHEMMREGLRKIVDEQDDLTVIAEASDGKEAIKIAHETSPDIVVMDVNMPGMNGIDATQEITSKMSNMRVIGLSLHGHENVIKSMKSAGASAYLTKNEAFETLCATIRSEATMAKG